MWLCRFRVSLLESRGNRPSTLADGEACSQGVQNACESVLWNITLRPGCIHCKNTASYALLERRRSINISQTNHLTMKPHHPSHVRTFLLAMFRNSAKLALMVVLALVGCSKDHLEPGAISTKSLRIGEVFVPAAVDVEPMIHEAVRRRALWLQGAKSGEGEKSLQEAAWLAEALMNYEKGDASRYAEKWLTGSVEYSFPVFIKEDGTVWLHESDFYESYTDAMSKVVAAVGEGKVTMLDHQLISIEGGIARMIVEWSDKDPTSAIGNPYTPSGTGCHDVDEGAEILTALLHWNFHGIAPEAPSYYTTIFTPGGDPWHHVFPNDEVEPNSVGATGYFGTATQNGGGAYFYNGNGFANAVCFPGAWERFVAGRSIVLEHEDLPYPLEIIRERVDWYSYFVGQIPIGNYPTGYYNHAYHFKVGFLVHPLAGG